MGMNVIKMMKSGMVLFQRDRRERRKGRQEKKRMSGLVLVQRNRLSYN